jgi:hypothetical protein
MCLKETTEKILRLLKFKREVYGDDNVNRFLERRIESLPSMTGYIESLRETVFGTDMDKSNDK